MQRTMATPDLRGLLLVALVSAWLAPERRSCPWLYAGIVLVVDLSRSFFSASY